MLDLDHFKKINDTMGILRAMLSSKRQPVG
jgi:GGDEF domain-containing protein